MHGRPVILSQIEAKMGAAGFSRLLVRLAREPFSFFRQVNETLLLVTVDARHTHP